MTPLTCLDLHDPFGLRRRPRTATPTAPRPAVAPAPRS